MSLARFPWTPLCYSDFMSSVYVWSDLIWPLHVASEVHFTPCEDGDTHLPPELARDHHDGVAPRLKDSCHAFSPDNITCYGKPGGWRSALLLIEPLLHNLISFPFSFIVLSMEFCESNISARLLVRSLWKMRFWHQTRLFWLKPVGVGFPRVLACIPIRWYALIHVKVWNWPQPLGAQCGLFAPWGMEWPPTCQPISLF